MLGHSFSNLSSLIMSLPTAEEYDENQRLGGIMAQVDDEMHSDQRNKAARLTDQRRVKACKIANSCEAMKLGITLGQYYHILDLRYIQNDIEKRERRQRRDITRRKGVFDINFY
jgi:hypothetical protein